MFAPRLIEVYIVWRKVDHYFHGWIIGTHSKETLNLVVSLNIAYVIWDALKNAYAKNLQEHEFTLKQQVTYFHEVDNKTIWQHTRTFKGLYVGLLTIGKPIPEKENILFLLTSLSPQFTTTMLKPPRSSYSELVS